MKKEICHQCKLGNHHDCLGKDGPHSNCKCPHLLKKTVGDFNTQQDASSKQPTFRRVVAKVGSRRLSRRRS